MKSSYKLDEARETIDIWRGNRESIGFVPTMGALHKGHLSLIERAKRDNKRIVVSIFVNPLQFNDKNDFDNYPSTLEQDRLLLDEAGVDLLIAPAASEMHPQPMNFAMSVKSISDVYEGQFRPGHFDGVATVVAKLLLLVGPSRVYFGEKDIQQCYVIKRMVEEFHFPNVIEIVETYREASGLAFSSRNTRLSDASKRIAPSMYQNLLRAAKEIRDGSDPATVINVAIEKVAEAAKREAVEFGYDYVELIDQNFKSVAQYSEGLRIVAAWTLDGVRLIDNLSV